MKKYIPAFLIGLLVAAVWGYFADLRNDQVGWFVGRLIVVPIVIIGVLRVFGSPTPPDESGLTTRRR